MSKAYKKTTFILLIICVLTPIRITAQNFANDPFEILKIWDYYKMVERKGEGKPIIDTMSGQAYIAGMRYDDRWLGKQVQLDFMFNDIDISEFTLRFLSPFMDKRLKTRIPGTVTPGMRDSLLSVFKIQDSINRANIDNYLTTNPGLLDSLKSAAKTDSVEQKHWYDMDSLRCDSLVAKISGVMGAPIRQGLTNHIDKQARYSAVWINHGYSVLLRDNTDYTDLVFSISTLKSTVATGLAVNPKTEILKKFITTVHNDTLHVSLLGLPDKKSVNSYTDISIMIETNGLHTYLEKVFKEDLFDLPDTHLIDFNTDGIDELWVTAHSSADKSCRFDQIYTLELIEPIVLFDFFEETVYSIGGIFVNGFQAEMQLSDGSKLLFPLPDKDKLVPTYYSNSGELVKDEMVIPGCMKDLKVINEDKGKPKLQGQVSLTGETYKSTLGYLNIVWELRDDVWEITESKFENKELNP